MNYLVQLTGDAVLRQEALANDIFTSSNRVNLAVSEVAMNSDAIQTSTQSNLDLAQRSLEPVSYTHLDVYKRQSQSCAASKAAGSVSAARISP